MFDIVVKGGRIVTPSADGIADVGIKDGRVAAIGKELEGPALDAQGKLVLPGGMDMHVHLTESPLPTGERLLWADDFGTGSRAAAAGGITTVGNMSYPEATEGLLPAVDRISRDAAGKSIVDYMLHTVVARPDAEVIEELSQLKKYGHSTIKLFLSRPYFDAHVTEYLQVLQAAGSAGLLPLVHCEDSGICTHVSERLSDEGKTSAAYYGESRPAYAEEAAIVRALSLAQAANTPIYIVHISTQAGLEAIQRARMRGWRVYAETRPLYLYQSEEVHGARDGAKYVGRPPVRGQADMEAMWAALGSQIVDTYCSDHAPWNLAEKLEPELSIAHGFRAGHADLDTLLPQLFSETVLDRGWSLQWFVDVTSTRAARIFGVFPRKGTIAVGSDADLAVWDPERTWRVDSAKTQTRSDFSLYEGQWFTGWPEVTMVRGEVVFRDGKVEAEPGHGRLVTPLEPPAQ